jgi:hypothetical protein
MFNIESRWIEPTEITSYDPAKHWNPKLYIENVFQEPKEDVKYSLAYDNNNNLIVTEKREVKGNLTILKHYIYFNDKKLGLSRTRTLHI